MREEESPAANGAIKSSAGGLNDSSVPELSPFDPIYEARLQSWLEGFHARDAEIRRLNWEADLWYFCHANKKTPRDYYKAATEQLWAGALR